MIPPGRRGERRCCPRGSCESTVRAVPLPSSILVDAWWTSIADLGVGLCPSLRVLSIDFCTTSDRVECRGVGMLLYCRQGTS